MSCVCTRPSIWCQGLQCALGRPASFAWACSVTLVHVRTAFIPSIVFWAPVCSATLASLTACPPWTLLLESPSPSCWCSLLWLQGGLATTARSHSESQSQKSPLSCPQLARSSRQPLGESGELELWREPGQLDLWSCMLVVTSCGTSSFPMPSSSLGMSGSQLRLWTTLLIEVFVLVVYCK